MARHRISGTKRYACSMVDCQFVASRRDNLSFHERKHHKRVSKTESEISTEGAPANVIQRERSSIYRGNPHLHQESKSGPTRDPISSCELESRVSKASQDSDSSDGASITSTSDASVASGLTANFWPSSDTELSRPSDYSSVQVTSATKVLIHIFYQDKVLLPLYCSAVENSAIGPIRLERNLRRLLKLYAKNLQNEACNHLQHLALKFVSTRARWLAYTVVDRVVARSAIKHATCLVQSSDESGNESNESTLNEDTFEDLALFREFLSNSNAFTILRVQICTFALSKCSSISDTEDHRFDAIFASKDIQDASQFMVLPEVPGLSQTQYIWQQAALNTADAYRFCADSLAVVVGQFRLLLDFIHSATIRLLIAMGNLEPPLRHRETRLRWSCVCTWRSFSILITADKCCRDAVTSYLATLRKPAMVVSPS
jgi:hypothetical protein